jgi:hypothetical protein
MDEQKKANLWLFSTWPYYGAFLMVFPTLALYELTGNTFVILWIFYSVIPFLDHIIPVDKINPNPEQERELMKDDRFRMPMYAFLVADIYITITFLANLPLLNTT